MTHILCFFFTEISKILCQKYRNDQLGMFFAKEIEFSREKNWSKMRFVYWLQTTTTTKLIEKYSNDEKVWILPMMPCVSVIATTAYFATLTRYRIKTNKIYDIERILYDFDQYLIFCFPIWDLLRADVISIEFEWIFCSISKEISCLVVSNERKRPNRIISPKGKRN